MGWFWQSPSAPPASTPNPKPASVPTQGDQPSASKPTVSSGLFPDDDEELNKFIAGLQGEEEVSRKPNPPTPSAPKTASPTSQQQPLPGGPRTERSPESIAMSELMLPTTMSCRDAFDYAYHCNSPGGQWSAVYRSGEMRSCSELWGDFWFCLRVRRFSDEMRADAVRAHYREKERRLYGSVDPDTGRLRPSSEDVWRSRPAPVAPGTEFRRPFPPPEPDDAILQRAMLERRRRVREELGFDPKE